MELHPIGVIRSPFTRLDGMPIQPSGAAGVAGSVEVFPEYAGGLQDLDGPVLSIEGVDILDGTPLLDIKPYVPAFDAPRGCRTGWLEGLGETAQDKRSDDRFK